MRKVAWIAMAALLCLFLSATAISKPIPGIALFQASDQNAVAPAGDANAPLSPALLNVQERMAELENAIAKMRQSGLSTNRVSDGLVVARAQFDQETAAAPQGNSDFPVTRKKIAETLALTKLAFEAKDETVALEKRLDEVRQEIDPKTVEELLQKAKQELKDERYEQSIGFSQQGQEEIVRLQSFNTKAQAMAEALAANVANFLDRYKVEIISAIVILAVLIVLLQNRVKHFIARSRIRRLELERETIKKEIMQTQQQFFDNKMPENMYHVRTTVFNEKMREITRKLAVLMEAEKRTTVFGLFPVREKLKRGADNKNTVETEKKGLSGLVTKSAPENYTKTGIAGLDTLLTNGIPTGSSILIEGGPGSGKTLLCLQIGLNACKAGKKVLYMSFEEREDRLAQHIEMFGFTYAEFEKKGLLMLKRFNALDIARSVEALLSDAKKELLINVQPVLIPKEFSPDLVIIDSLTSISSAFSGEEYRFRIYMEQLFRYLEAHNITSFLIRETASPTHIGGERGPENEEAVSFLSDGIIALYTVLYEDGFRKRALEIIKLRGEDFERKLVEMRIENKKGITVLSDHQVVGKYKLT